MEIIMKKKKGPITCQFFLMFYFIELFQKSNY